MRVMITPRAQTDLEKIGDYIAEENPDRAISFARELIDRCLSLSENLERLPIVERLSDTGMRKLTYGNYLIFYRVYPDRVAVARVLHATSDYEARLSTP